MADDEKRTEPKTAAELAAEWAQAKNEAAAHKDAAKAFGQRADAIEEAMLGAFEDEGVVKVTVNADAISAHLDANNEVFLQREPSSYTVSPYLLPVAKFPAGKDSAIALLQGSPEWGWLVKPGINTNTMASTLRELVGDDGDGIPEDWKGVIEVDEITRISLTRAK